MSDEQPPDEDTGDPVADVFPPDRPEARFVVAMSMARNDIERALHDLLRSNREHSQDFTYRVRLLTGHLVEAVEAINYYRQEFADVRKLLARVPAAERKQLARVVGALQRAGKGSLERIRHHTFHYPSPDPAYKSDATSDDELAAVLADMKDFPTYAHHDGDTNVTTLTYADEAAIRLAFGPGTAQETILQRSEVARDAALAFRQWAISLMTTYVKTVDGEIGKPIVSEKPPPKA